MDKSCFGRFNKRSTRGVDVNLIREVNDFLRKEDGFADKVITSVDRDTGEMIILNYGKHTR